VLNNTRWKGLTLKVQYAKESFLEKLKRERAQGQGGQVSSTASGPASTETPTRSTISKSNGYERRPFRPEKPKPPDNFDFEIVETGDEIKPSDRRDARAVRIESELKSKESEPKAKKIKTADAVAVVEQKPKFVLDNQHSFATNLVGFEEAGVVNAPPLMPRPIIVQTKPQPKKLSPKGKKTKKKMGRADSDSSDDSSADEKDGIPRFRGLASYGDALFVPSAPPLQETPGLDESQLESPEAIPPNPAFATAKVPVPAVSPPKEFKLKMNPHKKAKSDELRIKSLSAREEQLTQRSNFIRSSLSKVEPPAVPPTATSAESKEALFAEEEDDDGNNGEISFNVKPQYEGTSGQKMLKLKSSYGDDERFQLDERFADSSIKKSEKDTLDNSEQDMQLGVLEKLIGPTAPIPKSKPKPKEDLRFVRFDPTLAEHQKFILNPHKLPANTSGPSPEEPKKDPKKKSKEQEKAIEEEKAKLKDPTAKATFKVAENLKTLFAKTSEATPSFSFLAAFGSTGTDEPEDSSSTKQQDKRKKDSKPRDNWSKNPFKYDSSDEEEEVTTKTNQAKIKKLPAAPIPTPSSAAAKPEVKPGHGFFKQESFFFGPKDERLKGIFGQFLSSMENSEQVVKEFNESGRSELKAIARSKMKNAKRKGEKKVKFMRLVRKKKKREALAKQKKYEERKAILNKTE